MGCDSIITLHLSVYESSAKDTTVYICSNCVYSFFGQDLNTTGGYQHSIKNVVGCDSIITLNLYVGQINGSDMLCQKDTGYYNVLNPANGISYVWYANNGTIFGNNPADSVKAVFDSTHPNYITLTAIDTATNNKVLYRDTIWVTVAALPHPKLATTGGVGCQLFKDSIADNGGIFYYLDTTTTGNTKVCEHNSYKYYVKNASGSNSVFSWVVTGGITIATGGDSAWVLWGNAGIGSITLTETTATGCSKSRKYLFDIIPSPKAKLVVNTSSNDTVAACIKTPTLFENYSNQLGNSTIKSWVLHFGDGTPPKSGGLPLPNSVQHKYTASGYYTAILTVVNDCNCEGYDTVVVRVYDSTGVGIVCNKAVCENAKAYYSLDVATNISSCTKAQLNSGWSVTGGHIIDTMGNAITVLWDNVGNLDSVEIRFDNSVCPIFCPAISVIKIKVIKTNLPIVGDSVVCSNSWTKYSIFFVPGNSYTWSATNAAVKTTNVPNEVYIKAYNNSATVDISCVYYNVLAECGSQTTKTVGVLPKSLVSASSPTACKGNNVQLILTGIVDTNWHWQITKPDLSIDSIAAQDTLNYTLLQVGTYSIIGVGSSMCGSNTATITVFDKPNTPDSLQGADTVCNTQIYTYGIAHPKNGIIYNWFVVGNASFLGLNTGTQVNVQYSGGSSWQIKVVATNENGCSSDTATLSIKKLRPKNGFVAFDSVACPDTRIAYELIEKNAESYEWSIDPGYGGSIASSNGTAKATIIWNHLYTGGYVDVVVKIRKCGGVLVIRKAVYIQPAPQLSLVVDSSVCRGSALQMKLVGATVSNMLWSFGNGDTVRGNNTMAYIYKHPIATPTAYTISATVKTAYANGCTYFYDILYSNTVIVKPTPVVDINPSGTIKVCSTVNQSLTSYTNTNYGNADVLTWVTPTGNTSCGAPFSCNPYTATTLGNYQVMATNNSSGCSSISKVVAIVNNCGAGSCNAVVDSIPIFTVVNNTINNCGNINIQGSCTSSSYTGSWELYTNPVQYFNNIITTIIDKIGIYDAKYSVNYKANANGERCRKDTTIKIVVAALPTLNYTLQCNSNNTGYVLTVGDYSLYLDSTTIISYYFYIDNILQQSSLQHVYKDSSFALGSHHSMYIVVNYSYKGINGSCTTATQSFGIPTIPTASFTISNSAKHCEKLTLLFKPDSAFDPNNSYWWDFKDNSLNILYAPEKVYDFNNPKVSNNPSLFPSLKVSNGLGCVVTSSQNWLVVHNELDGKLNPPLNYYLCPNTNQAILFNTSVGAIAPTQFMWFNSRKPTDSLRVPVDSGDITHNPYIADKNGSYWVRVEDNDGCYKAIDGNAVVAIAVVTEPKISSSPALEAGNDTLNVCVNSPTGFTLNTAFNPTAGYIWYMNGVIAANNTGTNTINYPKGSLDTGLYIFKVYTAVNVGSGKSCDTISKAFYVRILPAPATPVINYGNINCSNYAIELVATSSTAGIFSWSNGNTSVANSNTSSTTVIQGGLYSVNLNTGLQCNSDTFIVVPDNPQAYLHSLPKGCYNICIDSGGLIIPMPPSPPAPVFVNWQWLMNVPPSYYNQLYTQGFNSSVPNLHIYNSGDYFLTVNNGLCSDTAKEIISINQPDTCKVKEQSCNFAITVTDQVWNCTCDSAWLSYSITNNTNYPTVYSITGGGMTIAGGVAAVGTNTYTSVYAKAQAGTGLIHTKFIFYTTVGNATQTCGYGVDFNIDTGKCPNCRKGKVMGYSKYNKATTKLAPIEKQKGTLEIVPNPAKSMIHIKVDKLIGGEALLIIDYLGRVVKRQMMNDKWLMINIEDLPKGLYIVQVKTKEGRVRSGKLVVE